MVQEGQVVVRSESVELVSCESVEAITASEVQTITYTQHSSSTLGDTQWRWGRRAKEGNW